MSTTLSDVLTSLAYRMGEDNSPTNASEKARRTNDINQAYKKVASHRDYWFMETSTTDSTVADHQAYALPSNFKDIVSLKVGSNFYTYAPELAVKSDFDKYDFPFYYGDQYDWGSNRNFSIYGSNFYLYPTPTSSSTDDIIIKHYSYPTLASSDSDTFLIPDMYIDCLDAYAYAKNMGRKGFDKEMNDGMEEFNNILISMDVDDTKRSFARKNVRPVSPHRLL